MKKFNSAIVLLGLLLGAFNTVAHPFASGVTNLQNGSIQFILNEPATDVSIVFDPANVNADIATNDLGAKPAGSNTFSLTYNAVTYTNFNIVVSNTGTHRFSQTSVDGTNNPAAGGLNPNSIPNPRALGVDRNPKDWRFGRIFIGNSSSTTPGIFLRNADLSDTYFNQKAYLTNVHTCNITTWINKTLGSSFSPSGISVGDDGRVYITSASTSTAGGFLTASDPECTTNVPVLGGLWNGAAWYTTETAWTAAGNPNHTWLVGTPHVTGSLATGDLKVIAVDGEYPPNINVGPQNFNGSGNSIQMWGPISTNLYSGQPQSYCWSQWATVPYGAGVANLQVACDCAVYGQYVYMSTSRSAAATIPGLEVFDTNYSIEISTAEPYPPVPAHNTALIFDSRINSPVNTNTDLFYLNNGIDVAPDGKFLVNYRGNDQYINIVPLTNGVPDQTTLCTNNNEANAASTTSAYGRVQFDAGYNIIQSCYQAGNVRSFSFGFDSVATTYNDSTGTNGSFNMNICATGSDITFVEEPMVGASLVYTPTFTIGAGTSSNVVVTSVAVTTNDDVGMTYQWYHAGLGTNVGSATALVNGGDILSGATGKQLSIKPVGKADAGTYYLVASDVTGSAQSSNMVLTVTNDPVIQTQPANTAGQCGTNNAKLTVVAAGNPLTYQWFFNGTALTDGGEITGSSTATLSLNPLKQADQGSYKVVITNATYTGSVTSSVVTFTVSNNVAPVVTITKVNGQNNVTNECGSTYTDAGATATQLCEGSLSVTTLGSVNTSVPGTYLVTYSATDLSETNVAKQTTTAVRTVKVVDTTPPVVSLVGASPYTQECHMAYSDPGATENDTCGGNSLTITTSGNLNANAVGTYLETYTCIDPSGNHGTAVRTINVVDTTAPVVTLTGASQMTNVTGVTFTDPGATASDACAGSLPVTTTGSVNYNVDGTYLLTYTATDPSANVGTAIRTVVVQDTVQPTITTQPIDTQVGVAGTTNITVVAAGGLLSYQWQNGGTNIVDGTNTDGSIYVGSSSATLTIENAGTYEDTTNAGSYTVVVTNTSGSITSSAVALTVESSPYIVAQPAASQSLGAGTNVIIGVGAVGAQPLAYQWNLDTGSGPAPLTDGVGGVIGGSSSATLTVSASDSVAGSYTVVITNTPGSITSSIAALSVFDPPAIITPPPVSQAINATSNLVISVVASGTSPSYFWKKGAVYLSNGGKISGSGTANLTVTGVADADAAVYSVIVSNLAGMATASDTISIVDPPGITTQPTSLSIGAGTNATFTIAASGTSPSYYWSKVGVGILSNGGNISGSGTASLTVAGVADADAGSYSCTASNQAGTATSSTATLTVYDPPAITAQPMGATITNGFATSLSVTATGTSLTYQWQNNGANVANTATITGATTSSLSLSNPNYTNSGSYTVIITNLAGAVTSSPAAVLVVLQAPSIITQPQTVIATNAGSSATFTVVAAGNPLNYQWYFDGIAIGGATASSYIIPSVSTANIGFYSVVISNAFGSVTSSSAQLQIGVLYFSDTLTNTADTSWIINSNSTDVSTNFGWNFNTNVGVPAFTNTANLAPLAPGAVITSALKLKADVANGSPCALSLSPKSLSVPGDFVMNFNLWINVDLGSPVGNHSIVEYTEMGIGTAGNKTESTLTTSDGVWFYADGIGGNGNTTPDYAVYNGSTLYGTNSGVYTAPYSLANPCWNVDNSYYTGIFPGNSVPATESTVLTNAYYWQTGSGPAGSIGFAWHQVTIAKSGSGTPTTNVTWTIDGQSMASVTNPIFNGNNISIGYDSPFSGGANDGFAYGTYNASNMIFALFANLSVATFANAGVAPTITAQPAATQTVDAGTTATISVSVSSPTTVTYQWQLDGTNITGATTSSLVFNNVLAANAGTYQVFMANASAPAVSSTAILNVTDPAISLQPVSSTNNCGSPLVLAANAGGTGATYQWYNGATAQSDGGDITGSTTTNLTFSNITIADAGSYSLVVTGTYGSVTSSVAVVAVQDVTGPVITMVGASTTNVQCTTSFTDPGASANDACDGPESVTTAGSVNTGAVGTYLITYSSTDAASNVGTAIRTVNVINTNPPVVSLIGPATTNIECSSSYTDPGATASSACDGSVAVATNNPANANAVGTYIVTYVATDPQGNVGKATRTVTVSDSMPPVITLIGASTTNVECASVFVDPGATANDACAGSETITTNGTVNTVVLGTYLISYTASDVSGNSVTNTRTVNVVDTTAPVVTVNGGATTTNIECHTSFTDPGALANDACAGSEAVTTSGTVDPNTVGTYILTYSATDANTNTGTATLTVTVSDTTPPLVTANATNVTTECHQVFADPGATAIDTCAGSLSATASSDLDTNTLGTYIVTYTATDPSGNPGTATLTVTVVDTTPPMITPNASSPVTVVQPATYSEAGAVGNDACAGTVSVTTSGTVDSSTLGTYYVTYTASDPSGNSATNVLTVFVVINTEPPGITTQPASVTNNAGTTATFTVAPSGYNLTYQWYKGTNALSDNATFSGTTNAILTISSVLHTNDGSYSVVITNDFGTTSSAPAVLTVIDPAINTQPVSQTNYVGGPMTIFSVVAAGTTNLSYQWYSTNTGGHAFAKMTGKTNASLTIATITTSSAGGYEVVVTNHFGSVTSTVAILKDNTPVSITTQPANLDLVAGNNATFTVKAGGTAPFTYQWQFDGVAIGSATNSSYTVVDVQSPTAGTYTCAVTNITQQGAVSGNTHGILTVKSDVTKPAVSLSFPPANLRITNGLPTGSGLTTSTGLQVYLVGGATDNGLVTNVTIRRIAPTVDAPINATLTEIAPGKQTFAQLVTLEDGINTYQLVSYDSAGNPSSTLTRSVLAVNLQTFTIDITGNGTTVPLGSLIVGPNSYGIPTSGAMLINTHTYQVKAVPDFNNLFTNWTATNGGVLSTNVKYTFTMSSNLTINANFVTNPIIAANMAGAYNGLFYPTNATNVSEENAGFLGNVLVKTNRLYSGKLVVGGISYTLSGAFDLTGNVTQVLSRATHGLSNLLVTMTLEWGDGSQQIRGSVSNIDTANMGNPWNAPLTADLATNTLPVSANLYTMLIPPGTNADGLSPTNAPGGYGYASVTNTPSGIVYVTGALGDGTPLLQEVPMSKDGTFPFYVSLFKNTGVVEGWLGLGTGSPTGSVTMIKPSGVITPATYPSGYTSTATVAGSPYTPGSNPVMSVPTNSTLTVDDSEAGGLGTLTWHVTISNNNALAVISGATNKVTGTFIPQRGIFSIKFQPTGKPASQDKTASGVVLQNTTNAGGWFLGVTNTGSLYLSP